PGFKTAEYVRRISETVEGGSTMGLLGKVRGYMRSSKGQTMTEYVLVVSAVAVAVYAGYQRTGQILNTMVSTVLTLL
ncbi:MAG: hypothetical protein JWM69_969, partial [Candidatus Binatus sp.]|nr:hypothetical protein [Candidatus Binatus sp.]